MSKKQIVNITIKNLNVTLGGGAEAAQRGLPPMLKLLLADAISGTVRQAESACDECEAGCMFDCETPPAPVEAPAPVETTSAPLADRIVEFLYADQQHNLRSKGAIAKGVGCGEDAVELDEALDDLVEDEAIVQRTRRRDGAAMYGLTDRN